MDQEIVPYGNGVALDFADRLPPGYRFCPTDVELIVYYLNAKIESRKLPECRLHEVNIYNHHPEELAERYLPSVDQWYFLTPRDRKYPNGDRPDRAVGNFGSVWKATQKQEEVFDANRQVVGHKTGLTLFKNKKIPTIWRMKEYTTNRPNIPCGGNSNMLNEWVLCKIYKKEETPNSQEVGKRKNREEVIKEPNGTPDIPLRKRRQASKSSKIRTKVVRQEVGKRKNREEMIKEPNGTPDIPLRKRRQASKNSEIRAKTKAFPNPMQPMTTFQDSNLIQPSPLYQHQFTSTSSNNFLLASWYQNQITSTTGNNFLYSDGASTSGSIEPPPTAENGEIRTNNNPFPNPMQPAMTTFQDSNLIEPAPWYQNRITSTAISNNHLFSDGASTFGSTEPPTTSENGKIRTNTNPFPNPMQPMTTFQDSNLIEPASWYQNQITSTTSSSFLFPDGASTTFGSVEPPTAGVKSLNHGCYTSVMTSNSTNYDIPQQNVQNSFQDPKTQLNVQSGSNDHMVVPHDAAHHIPQQDGYNATLSPPDADKWIFDDFDPDSFDCVQELMLDWSPISQELDQ